MARTKKTNIIESAEIAEAVETKSSFFDKYPLVPKKRTKKVVEVWPKVVVGSHLTVTTHEDGRTELKWDDEALLKDVRAALLKAESVLTVAETKPKKTKSKKVI